MTNFAEMIKELKDEIKKTQQEAMNAFRSKILKETGASMKELMMSMQQQLMADVQELIKTSLTPMTQMLTELTAQNRAAVQNIKPENINKNNNKNNNRLRSGAKNASKQ